MGGAGDECGLHIIGGQCPGREAQRLLPDREGTATPSGYGLSCYSSPIADGRGLAKGYTAADLHSLANRHNKANLYPSSCFAQIHPATYGYTQADTHTHAGSDANGNTDSNTKPNSNTGADSNAYTGPHADAAANVHTATDSNAYSEH